VETEEQSEGHPIADVRVELSPYASFSTSYHHQDRLLTAREPLILPGAFFKWYELRQADDSIPEDLSRDGRAFLGDEVSSDRIAVDHGVGLVVLHYSRATAYLIVGTWNDNQEFQETLYQRVPGSDGQFQPCAPGTLAPVPCVWELAPVWHERQAWTRYLFPNRDSQMKHTFLSDYLRSAV